MIATTIMISTSVKPALRAELIFILTVYLSFFCCGVNEATGGFTINAAAVHKLPVTDRYIQFSKANANKHRSTIEHLNPRPVPAFRQCVPLLVAVFAGIRP